MTMSEKIKIPKGATYMLDVCDTFNYKNYLVFAFGEEDLTAKRKKYTKNMQRINSVVGVNQFPKPSQNSEKSSEVGK